MKNNTAKAGTATPPYCPSRYRAFRRATNPVNIGGVRIGGENPIRIQSMTTSDTLDIAATVRQCVNLAQAGCEIIRITTPNHTAARALRDISRSFRDAGYTQPLVADVHFIPAVAMEAAEHVEKIRVNPGNYADKKRFNTREYTDAEYEGELQRIYEAFSPLVLRAKTLGRALRIGVNHGSLSDRLMNRYGDSPEGMVESALEFVRICESHGFHDIVLSMKSSNPRIMIAAYRLATARMQTANMFYPLHLGVTEAGEGQDGRIKSAIGIGSLLYDGLGDTIRVSLTEDPWFEIPVAKELAQKAELLWKKTVKEEISEKFKCAENTAPLNYYRRETVPVELASDVAAGGNNVPRVIVPASLPLTAANVAAINKELRATHATQREIRAEGLLVQIKTAADFSALPALAHALNGEVKAIFAQPGAFEYSAFPEDFSWKSQTQLILVTPTFINDTAKDTLQQGLNFALKHNFPVAIALSFNDIEQRLGERNLALLKQFPQNKLIFTVDSFEDAQTHPLGFYRRAVEMLKQLGLSAPFWIRNTLHSEMGFSFYNEQRGQDSSEEENKLLAQKILSKSAADFPSRLIESSILSGSLLCEGFGDLISVEDVPSQAKSLTLAYDILQGARVRVSKTEYVACPSCGRTLFDIQATTQKIKAKTGHLKGVTIAVMGCIVNGPGEMADADFGYVGGAPGKINLYVKRECVTSGIPQENAVEHLVNLIKEHRKWVEPPPV
ncbi:MAG: (E)-4-hydroxy-3-methylbut-2-enyl-diphosphate synthase [Puniceicoccales bacterium]|nr:(E)-4-hydroxy-3-methylbut-2-enyl-diphosphate synthase [Puniceicoccales bacterium]